MPKFRNEVGSKVGGRPRFAANPGTHSIDQEH
jgi:hypothetical protein